MNKEQFSNSPHTVMEEPKNYGDCPGGAVGSIVFGEIAGIAPSGLLSLA